MQLGQSSSGGIAIQEEIDSARTEIAAVMREIGDELLEPVPDGKPGQRRVRMSEWPDLNSSTRVSVNGLLVKALDGTSGFPR